jgi:hypothetical protein
MNRLLATRAVLPSPAQRPPMRTSAWSLPDSSSTWASAAEPGCCTLHVDIEALRETVFAAAAGRTPIGSRGPCGRKLRSARSTPSDGAARPSCSPGCDTHLIVTPARSATFRARARRRAA